jgi:hypothetical protein
MQLRHLQAKEREASLYAERLCTLHSCRKFHTSCTNGITAENPPGI